SVLRAPHSSDPSATPSPQTVASHGSPGTSQWKLGSRLQRSSQPSPDRASHLPWVQSPSSTQALPSPHCLPSSQSSSPATRPSPHSVAGHVPAREQVQPSSRTHAKQPGASACMHAPLPIPAQTLGSSVHGVTPSSQTPPRSQVSCPPSRPSPQRTRDTQGPPCDGPP